MSGVLLVAKDVGLAAPLAMVSAELAKLGIGCSSFLRGGPSRDCVRSMMVEGDPNFPDFVLTGMSSSPELSEDEIRVLHIARECGIPFGVFSDTFGAWKGRDWFEGYRQNATALFVLNEEEAAEARVKYPNAKVFGYGNPRWAEFFTQRMTSEEVRSKIGAYDTDIVVEVPGGKDLQVNLAHFGAVISAAEDLNRGDCHFVVFISLHPGDKNPRSEYEKLVDGKSFVRITDKSIVSADDMLAGADMVVQSASTVGVTAACQRIPVINYFSKATLDRLEGNIHSREWPPVLQGTEVVVVDDIGVLRSKMVQCLVDYNHSSILPGMLERQVAMYPKPTGKPASALIAEALRDLIGKK